LNPLGVTTKYGIFVPSFDVASNCSVFIPFASKKAGSVLTFTGARPPSESQSEAGVVKSS
jgi:hypothetical protein